MSVPQLLFFIAFSISLTFLGTHLYYQAKLISLEGKLRIEKNSYERLKSSYQHLLNLVDAFGVKTSSKEDVAYETLGLAKSASPQEIKNKYRLLVKQYHPDYNKTKQAAKKFQQIVDAYQTLQGKR